MKKQSALKAWIEAARLRTIPLSISGILVGSAYAYLALKHFPEVEGVFQQSEFLLIITLGLVTTVSFQVLSNFANDYGDGVKGTDNENRIGPKRAVQTGAISSIAMKRGMIVISIFSFISAVFLIYLSLGIDRLLVSLFFMVLGIISIWAAIKYTVGENAYGYRGLGDLFVFIFFGPVSVLGMYYLLAKELELILLLPAISVGLLSVAVLNLNNMRDMASDKLSNKNTLVVKIGIEKAKKFHFTIIGLTFLTSLSYCIYHYQIVIDSGLGLLSFLPVLAWIPLIAHCIRVKQNESPALLDPELKKVALSTFLYALLTCVSVVVS